MIDDNAIIYTYGGLNGKLYGSTNAYKVQQIVFRERNILKEVTKIPNLTYKDFKRLYGVLINEEWLG